MCLVVCCHHYITSTTSTLYERQLHILCMFMFRLSSVPSGVRPTTILRPLATCFVWSGRYIYIRMDLKKEEEELYFYLHNLGFIIIKKNYFIFNFS